MVLRTGVAPLGVFVCVALLSLGILTPWASALAQSKQVHISLLAINDFHGNIAPPGIAVPVPDASDPAGARVSAGGAAYLSTLVRQQKALNPGNTLVVGAGDLLGATPLVSGLFHDEPTVEVLNHIGLDISSVGNHEFDKGAAELMRLQNGGCYPRSADGSSGVVGGDTCMNQGRFEGARFKYLAANVIHKASGKTLLAPYEVRDIDGIRIGFIGLTLRGTPAMVMPSGIAGLEFRDEVRTINALVPELKAQGVSVFVVLIHQGGQTTARTALDKSCPAFSGDILDIADRLDPAVQVVISGHTHQEYVCTRPDGRLITQSGFYGRLLTRIDLTVERASGKLLAKDANNLVVVNDQPLKVAVGTSPPLPAGYGALAPDPQIAAIVRRYGDLTATIADLPIGRIAGPLDRQQTPNGESTLGALISDAFLAGASRTADGAAPAQIAFTNPGGVRADLNSTLSVSYGQLFSVMPFNNALVSMDLTGAQLLRLLEQQWEGRATRSLVLHVSEGFSYSWDAARPAGQRVLPGSAMLHGEPIRADAMYRVATNSFLGEGGDGFTIFKQGKNVQTGELDSVVLKLYFRAKGVVQVPTLGRITRLN
jgi:5'-nucleotidase